VLGKLLCGRSFNSSGKQLLIGNICLHCNIFSLIIDCRDEMKVEAIKGRKMRAVVRRVFE
jgi:hypothetical protein